MTRARLISALLAGSMLLSMVGCCWHRPYAGERVWFPRWRAWRDRDWCEPAPACCETGAIMTSGPIIQSGPPVVTTTPPPVAPTPRVVPVPQTAAPIQYTP